MKIKNTAKNHWKNKIKKYNMIILDVEEERIWVNKQTEKNDGKKITELK